MVMRSVSGKASDSRVSAYWRSAQNKRRKAHRSGDVGAGDTLGSGVEEVECARLADLGNDLGSNTEGCCQLSTNQRKLTREAALDRDEVVGLLDRRDDGVDVKGTDGAGVSAVLGVVRGAPGLTGG